MPLRFPEDWTLHPLQIVKRIFDESGSDGDWREKTSEYFARVTTELGAVEKLPWLNATPLHNLTNGQVVRFRGMIQDMYDNEFFLDTYQVVNTKTNESYKKPGRYSDVATCGPDEQIVEDYNKCDTGDRLSFYCVSIPAEAPWVTQLCEERNPSTSIPSSSQQRSKRTLEDDESDFVGESMETNQVDVKKICNGGVDQRASTSKNNPSVDDLNLPIPDAKGIGCIIKLYNNESFILNDMVEVIGILSVDPAMAPADDEEMEELHIKAPPPSLVPRLHVLTIKKMEHANPYLPTTQDNCRSYFAAVEDPQSTRDLLRQVLTEGLMGDANAAEMVMCHLVASVYLRQDIKPMGKWSLNISGINKSLLHQEYNKKFFQLLQYLCTQIHYYPFTIENLNTTKFVPEKNYDTNKLTSGLLQLPKHTHLVLDETTLTKGQLVDRGVKNVGAVAKMIKWQKVDYNFQFHQLEQVTDIQVLILSEAKAMVECDALIKLSPEHTDVAAAFDRVERMLSLEVLKRLRIFITAARLSEFTLTDRMQEMISDDFVECRQNKTGITGEDLHDLLIISRLLSKSCGQRELTQEVWTKAKEMHKIQKSRKV